MRLSVSPTHEYNKGGDLCHTQSRQEKELERGRTVVWERRERVKDVVD